jgi:hypothetical protein
MTSLAVRYDRGSPTIVIFNRSQIPDRELRKVVAAVRKQVDRDFFPLWGWRAKLKFEPRSIPADAMQIRIGNRDRDGLLGYHLIDGIPRTVVYTRSSGGKLLDDWPATLSHEVLEMIVDPGVNLFADGFIRDEGRRRRAFVPYEVCDPVQANAYEIDGIGVSDFVVPEWFEPERRPRSLKFSFRESVDRPFALAPGGYIDAVVNGRLKTLWGPEANRKKRRHRLEMRKARFGG